MAADARAGDADAGITLVICTHNPKERNFVRCLEALRGQTLDRAAWELLVVDNRSDAEIARTLDLSWHPHARIVREEKLGLTPARLRGIQEAAGALLVFVDDDNVLDADYLEVAARVASERAYLGAWSGQCRPGFEAQPPDWTRRYWGNLVIREFEADAWSNQPRLPATMPCGAGLCVRREVARAYLQLNLEGKRRIQLDRTGGSLLSGGDNDLAGCACRLGLGVGLISGLRLTHLIPPDRLTADYLERLAEGIHLSSAVLDDEYGLPVRPRSLLRRIADAARALRMREPHRSIFRAALRGHDRGAALVASKGRA
ncbi:MAG TPA: glycosyltransferase [Usitatibacter sp.]|nr:glycosyltransferase [Usitatibacter sp.]